MPSPYRTDGSQAIPLSQEALLVSTVRLHVTATATEVLTTAGVALVLAVTGCIKVIALVYSHPF